LSSVISCWIEALLKRKKSAYVPTAERLVELLEKNKEEKIHERRHWKIHQKTPNVSNA